MDHKDFPGTAGNRCYHTSGQVAGARYGLCLMITLSIALGMAWLLYRLFVGGHYTYVYVPALLFLPVAGGLWIAVRLGHCRNVWVAAAAGVLLSVAFYLGYFHVHLVSLAGPRAIHRLDLLPQFIIHRMQSDVIGHIEVGKPLRFERAPIHKWVLFGIELLGLAWGGAIVSMYAVCSRCYCEHCGRWMKSRRVVGPPGTGQRLDSAMQAGIIHLLPLVPTFEGGSKEPHALFHLEYCPGAKADRCHAAVYLTVVEYLSGWTNRRPRRSVFIQRELRVEELALLAEKVPGIEPPFAQSATGAAETAPTGHRQRYSGFVVESLPRSRAAATHSPAMRPVLLSLYGLPFLVTCIGAVMLLIAIAGWVFTPPPPWTLAVTIGASLTLLAGAIFVWALPDFFAVRLLFRGVAREIELRPEPLVRPHDPEAIYVQIVPRQFWGRWVPPRAVDSGFLKVDPRTRTILFEGAVSRYRIDAEAVRQCRVEPVNPAAGSWVFYAVALRIGCPPGESPSTDSAASTELALLPRFIGLVRSTGQRRLQLAEKLRETLS